MNKQERNEKILRLIQEGFSHRDIERQTGFPLATISGVRKRAGLADKSGRKATNYLTTTAIISETPVIFAKSSALQPYNLIYKNGEVDVETEEELSSLEKILEKLSRKGVNIGGLNYQGKEKSKSKALKPYHGNPKNILVIADIHSPYIIDGYLEFCRKQQEKWDCGTIVYIGDIMDFNAISYHEKTPEELNPKGELALAREVLQDWYDTFPNAYVCWGNHDLLPYRQAKTAGLMREFIQSPHAIFGAPSTYKFVDEIELHGVLYTHGTKGDAFVKCVKEGINLVQGHLHTKSGLQYHSNRSGTVFGMQVGVGIDYKSKAFDYARFTASQPVVACGVVLNEGNLPIFLRM